MRVLSPHSTVQAEPVEALPFFCGISSIEGQPFNGLRANGVCGHGDSI
jgi:hypothetical protein